MLYIKKSLEDFPEFLTPQDLVTLGIYSNASAAYQARRNGVPLPYVKMGKKILYPKQALIEFLDTKLNTQQPK